MVRGGGGGEVVPLMMAYLGCACALSSLPIRVRTCVGADADKNVGCCLELGVEGRSCDYEGGGGSAGAGACVVALPVIKKHHANSEGR